MLSCPNCSEGEMVEMDREWDYKNRCFKDEGYRCSECGYTEERTY